MMFYSEVSTLSADGSCQPLLEAATPEIYRANPFRVLGLWANATGSEIRRQGQKLQMAGKYNAPVVREVPLALNPPPEEHDVREAVHTLLNDPQVRLVHELFWFWPLDGNREGTAGAPTQTMKTDVKQLAGCWLDLEKKNPSPVVAHNLAVLYHCLALDLERPGLRGAAHEEALRCWKSSLKRWRALLADTAFWNHFHARVQALEDPRVNSHFIGCLRKSLVPALLSINASLAARYAEEGDEEGVARQKQAMVLWQGPLLNEALRKACEPLRRKIKLNCENAEKEATEDPSKGDKVVRTLVRDIQPHLKTLDVLLPDDPVRDAVGDEVAISALRCAIAYGNNTENWEESLKLLQMILPIARGRSTGARIEEQIQTVQGNLKFERCQKTCWFCGKFPPDDTAVIKVHMHGDVETIFPNIVRYRNTTIHIPRCKHCEKAQHIGYISFLAFLLAFVVIYFLPDLVNYVHLRFLSSYMPGIAKYSTLHLHGIDLKQFRVISALAVGIALAFIVPARKRLRLAPESRKPLRKKHEINDFPLVRELLDRGWKFGEKPPNVQ